MAVSVVFGRAHSGKSHCCYQQIAHSLAKNERGIRVLIVPEQFSYQAEQKLTGILGATGAQSAEVLTFSRLAQRVFSAQSGAAKKMLSPSGKNMMVCHALHRIKNKLKVYGGSADKLGFVGQATQLFSELKRYGVTAQQLFEQSEKQNDTLSAQKLSDLALTYQTYDELMGGGYVDAEDNLYLAAALIAKGDDFSGAQIWVDEFSDFLPQHYAILESLAAKASQMTVCLCCDEQLNGEGVFAPSVRTFGKLREMCKERAISFGPMLYLDERKKGIGSKELLWLEHVYTEYSAPKYSERVHDISLYEAENPFEEVENCAREILALCREHGYRWRDIAVVCGDVERYGELVSTVFERYGIACFLSEKPAAIEHPFVLTVLSALDIFLKNWDYDNVFAYLKTGFANLEPEEVDFLENYVLASGIRGRAWTQEAAWDYRMWLSDGGDETELQLLERADMLRRRVCEPLTRLRTGIGSSRTVRQACCALVEFMRELHLFEQAQQWVESFRQSGELKLANQYSRIWNGMMEVFDQMVLIAGDKKLGIEAFRNMLASGFAAQKSGIIPQSVDQVVITDLPNGRTCDCRALFVLGCNSGCFPTVSTSEGILTDEERGTLANAGIELAPTMRQAAFDERFLIYKTLTKPTQLLGLSYSLADAEGAALLPSPVISTIRRVFPGLSAKNKDDAAADSLISAPVATFDELALRLRRIQREAKPDELWQEAARWYRSSSDFADRWSKVNLALCHSTEAGALPQELMEQVTGGTLYTSVSRLEKFSACPFSYFISFALRAKERKLLKIGPPDAGLLMHKVLELFGRRVQEADLHWNKLQDDWCRAVVSEITDEVAGTFFSGTMLAGKASAALVGRMRRNLVRCVLAVVDHMRRGQFEPVGCEVHFGENGRLPSVMIDLGLLGKMKINGVIDRIDSCMTQSGAYYRIVDYKSGSKRFSIGNIVNRLDLQLMVYLDAALQAKPGAKPAGMLYFRLKEPMVRSDSRPDEQTVKKELQKQMKMDGLVLADSEILAKMDERMCGESDILPVKLLKDGSYAKASSVASADQFRKLGAYVKDSLKQIGRQIMNGRIDIAPYRDKDNGPCSYCGYRSICQFDPAHSRCRELKAYHADEAWKVIGGEVRTDGGSMDRGAEKSN